MASNIATIFPETSQSISPKPTVKRPIDLQLEGLTKTYMGANLQVVSGVDLSIAKGEAVALLGPSGCGKTTTLMMIAGFTDPSAGEIRLRGHSVIGIPPEQRDIGVVFQNYALFPHMSVQQNIVFPLQMKRWDAAKARERVGKIMETVGLEGLGRRLPHELSGGQQQRVALARALVFEPKLLIMDEPLGALDKLLRERMQQELRMLHRELGTTILYVTHDQREALMLADRIGVMNNGQLQQIDCPVTLFEQPATRFVAGFVGDCNFLACRADKQLSGKWEVDVGGMRGESEGPGPDNGQNPVLAIRPHALQLSSKRATGLNGRVIDVMFGGETVEYSIQLSHEQQTILMRHAVYGQDFPAIGEQVSVDWDWTRTRVL